MRPQAAILQSSDVQLVGGWDSTPALDKGLLIGGGATLLLGGVLGMAGQKLGAKIALGVAGGMGAALAFLAVKALQNDNAGAITVDVLGGTALSSTVILALLLLGKGK